MTSPPTSYHNWLDTEAKRAEAINILSRAALPFSVHLKRDKRTGKQNNRQWAMLAKVAKSTPWHGQWLTAEDWKIIFMQALHAETRAVPNLNNDGFVILGRSSSSLTVQEHCDLTELIEQFAATKNIDLSPSPKAQQERKAG